MQNIGVVFIEEQPVATIDANGVRVVSRSGDNQFVRRIPLRVWRAFLDAEIGRLNDHDRAERATVLPFKRKKGAR